ncbi:MAG: MFS transporter [Pseudomonadota bacterium]
MSERHNVYRRHICLLVATAAAYSMSTLFSAMKPVLLTRFVEEHGWSDALAGLAVATPFIGIAIAAMIAPLTSKVSVRSLAIVLGIALIVSELASAYVHAYATGLIALQLVGGIAVGALMGASSRQIAMTEKSGPLFGAADMVGVLLMSSMIAGVGWAVGEAGLRGGYLVAALIASVLVVFMLPYRGAALATDDSKPASPLVVTRQGIAVVAMAVVFITSSGLGFTYMFTIAQGLGASYAEAGSGIGILLLVSALACLAGGWVSERVGPRRPLAVAFVVCALGWYGVVHATALTMFYVALVPAVLALQFNFPVLLDLAGSLDDEGRWGAIAAPLQTSGFAWAAILAGAIVGEFGVNAIPPATAIGMAICLVLLTQSRAPAMSQLNASST